MNAESTSLASSAQLQRKLSEGEHSSRNDSEETTASTSNSRLSLLARLSSMQTSVGDNDDRMAAMTAEAARNFSFAPASHLPGMNGNRHRVSASRMQTNTDSLKNRPVPFLATRRSRQFVPQRPSNDSNLIQEKVTPAAVNGHQETSTSPHGTHQKSISHLGPQSDSVFGDAQTSGFILDVPSHIARRASTPTLPVVHRLAQQKTLSNRIAHENHLEDSYRARGQGVSGDYEEQGEEGYESGPYHMNGEPVGYSHSPEFIVEQDFRQDSSQEVYHEHDQGDNVQTEWFASPQDFEPAPLPAFPIAGFSVAFMKQFEEYVRTHQQEARDAEQKWKNATIEEWKAGKYGESSNH